MLSNYLSPLVRLSLPLLPVLQVEWAWGLCTCEIVAELGHRQRLKAYHLYKLGGIFHTARAPNLRHDLITAKFSSVIPKQSDWSIMIS